MVGVLRCGAGGKLAVVRVRDLGGERGGVGRGRGELGGGELSSGWSPDADVDDVGADVGDVDR